MKKYIYFRSKSFTYLITFVQLLFSYNLSSQTSDVYKINSNPPPAGYTRIALKSTNADWKEVALPCYLWSYGCAATSAAMVAGYYDRHGFYCIYNGNINGGAAPMWWDSWTQNNLPVCGSSSFFVLNYDNSLSASKNGFDGRTTDGHVDDFWDITGCGGPDPDPWIGTTPPHDFLSAGNPCTADYLGTSQDRFGNSDGITTASYHPLGDPFRYTDCGVTINCGTSIRRDITEGLYNFFTSGTNGAYTVNDVYTQYVDTYIGGGKGFTFDDFKNEINADRPVIVHFNGSGSIGHTCVAYGYNNATNQIVIYDTWAPIRTEINWGGSITDASTGSLLDLQGVTVLKLNGTIVKNALNGICKVGVIVGPNDNIAIVNPPTNRTYPPLYTPQVYMKPNTYIFSPGDNINFYAQFDSYNCNTWVSSFRWKIVLFYSGGTFDYMSATLPGSMNWPNPCQSGSYWETQAIGTRSAGTLPGYNWERNDDGSINGKVIVESVDENGYINKSDDVFIKFNFVPNRPNLTLLDSDDKTITFDFNANGAASYKVNYGSGENPFTVNSGNEALEGVSSINTGNSNVFSLTNLNSNRIISITAINQYGESSFSNTLRFAKYSRIPYSTGFELGMDLYWTTEKSGEGCVYISSGSYSPHSGNVCLAMSSCSSGRVYTSSYADLHLNLHNEKDLMLEFWWKDFQDEYQSTDGIWISNNGGSSFIKVYDLKGQNYTDNVWSKHILNISSLVEQNNLELSKNFVIRFAQYGMNSISSSLDGFAFDDIKVYSNYFPPSGVQTTTLTLDKDAFLLMCKKPTSINMQNTNYGSYPMIRADEWTVSGYRTNSKSVLEFELSAFPTNTVIKSATLSLYANNPQPNDDYKQISNLSKGSSSYKSNACWLKRIIQEWDENTVTYSTAPQTTDLHSEYLPVSQTYTQNYINFDVTRLVDDMVKYPESSHGFMIELDNAVKYTRMAFASSDHSDAGLKPKLTIKYYIDNTGQLKNKEIANYESKSIEKNNSFSVYPVPTTNEITISSEESIFDYKIIDIFGKTVKKSTLKSSEHIVDCSDLNKGIYVIQIISNDRIESKIIEIIE